jgi:hypothetical protein
MSTRDMILRGVLVAGLGIVASESSVAAQAGRATSKMALSAFLAFVRACARAVGAFVAPINLGGTQACAIAL